MATAVSDADPDAPAQRETVAARILRIVAKAPVNILLIVVAVVWLVPTIGLALNIRRFRAEA